MGNYGFYGRNPTFVAIASKRPTQQSMCMERPLIVSIFRAVAKRRTANKLTKVEAKSNKKRYKNE
jgi:hypothetical protein